MKIKSRLIAATVGAVAVVGIGTAAYAYTATGTLNPSGNNNLSGQISTYQCSADTYASGANDFAFTDEHESNACSSVTVRIYYYNPSGYAGWSTTDTDVAFAYKELSGTDELDYSYHTAMS